MSRMFKYPFQESCIRKIARGVQVTRSLEESKRSKDLKESFLEAFGYILRRTRMDIDEKLKELSEVFSKAKKELTEIVKRNEEFIASDIERIEKTIRQTTEVCSKKQMERLRDVRGIYEQRIKICNDKAASGFRVAKTKYDGQIQKAEAFRDVMKQILKECLETDQFVKCVSSKTKEAVRQRKRITKELSETLKNAELSATEQLKEATKCHMDAKAETLKNLHQILKDTKKCLGSA